MQLAPNYLERTGYRLPTEAEWEYSCQAPASPLSPLGRGAGGEGSTARHYGRTDQLLPKYAWYFHNSKERS